MDRASQASAAFVGLPLCSKSSSLFTAQNDSHRSTLRNHALRHTTSQQTRVQCTLAPERTTPSIQSTEPTTSFPTVTSRPVPGLPDWRYAGPPLEIDNPGDYPAIVYFALTATQSLELDPFNQLLTSAPLDLTEVRVFSPTLPLHSDTDMAHNEHVFHSWAEVYASGGDLISAFVRRADSDIRHLIDSSYCTNNAVHVAGLSRGGLLAGLLAAKCEFVESCLMFAPVTSLSSLDEMKDLVEKGDLKVSRADLCKSEVVESLIQVPVRVYMGNMDRRVGTKQAFEFAHLLAETADKRGVRSPPHEFIMYCSVGKHGHGTPSDVFEAGAKFILSQIEDIQNNSRRKRRVDTAS